MKSVTWGFFVFAFTSSAWAMSPAERDYANQLEHRTSRFLQLFDPGAEVSVVATAKAASAKGGGLAWPGVKNAEQMDELIAKISDRDLQSVRIDIFSNKTDRPAEFKNLLTEFLGLPSTLVNINFKSLSKIGPTTGDNRNEWQQSLADNFKSFTTGTAPTVRFFIYGLALFGALLLGGLLFLVVTLKEKLNLINSSLVSKENSGPREMPRALPSAPSESLASAPRGGGESSSTANSLQALSRVSWVALLSDCYWCEQDKYAAWLWQNMPQAMRREVLDAWPLAQSYISYVTSLKTEERSEHNHPSYLQPLPLAQVSQADLQASIKKQNGLWRALSPMRRLTMSLSVADILTLEKLPAEVKSAKDNFANLSLPASNERSLPRTWDKKSLSVEDELFLLTRYQEVPPAFRPLMPSWLWVTLIPEAEAKKILNSFSAAEMASAWVGSPEVLKKIQVLIPEQKMKMIDDYKSSARGSWASPVLAQATRLGCQILATSAEPARKAA